MSARAKSPPTAARPAPEARSGSRRTPLAGAARETRIGDLIVSRAPAEMHDRPRGVRMREPDREQRLDVAEAGGEEARGERVTGAGCVHDARRHGGHCYGLAALCPQRTVSAELDHALSTVE